MAWNLVATPKLPGWSSKWPSHGIDAIGNYSDTLGKPWKILYCTVCENMIWGFISSQVGNLALAILRRFPYNHITRVVSNLEAGCNQLRSDQNEETSERLLSALLKTIWRYVPPFRVPGRTLKFLQTSRINVPKNGPPNLLQDQQVFEYLDSDSIQPTFVERSPKD